jgi:hypothetical protein
LRDHFGDAAAVCHDVDIVEPENAEALHAQKCAAVPIPSEPFGFEMLPAVDLDHKLRRVAEETGHVGSDRHLPGCTVQPMCADKAPDDAFGISGVPS